MSLPSEPARTGSLVPLKWLLRLLHLSEVYIVRTSFARSLMKFDAAWLERRPPLTSQSIPKTLKYGRDPNRAKKSWDLLSDSTQLDHSAEFRLVHLSDK